MIIFKDEENDSIMSFTGAVKNPFYIELAKIGEEAYANCIELNDEEVKHLIEKLQEHLKEQ